MHTDTDTLPWMHTCAHTHTNSILWFMNLRAIYDTQQTLLTDKCRKLGLILFLKLLFDKVDFLPFQLAIPQSWGNQENKQMSFLKNYPNEAIGVLRKKTHTCYKNIQPNKFTTEQLFLQLVDQSEVFWGCSVVTLLGGDTSWKYAGACYQ